MKKTLRKLLSAALSAVMLCMLCAPAWAEEKPVDTLQLQYTVSEETPIAGAQFSLYRVAQSKGAEWALCEDFAQYAESITLQDQSADDWRTAASTLAGYVARDGQKPLKTGETDEKGLLTWDGLQTGLYLILGTPKEMNGKLYTPSPILADVLYSAEDGIKHIDIKYEAEDVPEKMELGVLKEWKGDSSKTRPQEISVQLLKGTKVYDTVKLTAENNWQHTWKDLPVADDWKLVEEKVPDGYTVRIEKKNLIFVVTNTAKTTTPPTGTPSTGTPSTPGGSSLPQTGQLWWPVMLMAAAGIVLFALGWMRRKTS